MNTLPAVSMARAMPSRASGGLIDRVSCSAWVFACHSASDRAECAVGVAARGVAAPGWVLLRAES